MAPVFSFYRDMRSRFDAAQQVRQRMLVQNELRNINSCGDHDSFLDENTSDSSEKLQWQPLQSADLDNEAEEEKYIADAFGIDPSSRRVTVGDAYTTLMRRNAPTVLTNLFLNAIMRIGANGSICDAFAQATAALAMLNKGAIRSKEDEEEIQRLKRVACAALNASGSYSKRKKIVPRQIEKTLAEQLIVMCGLEKQLDATFVMNESGALNEEDSGRAASVLSKVFETDLFPTALRQTMDLFTCPSDGNLDTDEGLKKKLVLASRILRATVDDNDDLPDASFMFTQSSQSSVTIERFDACGLTPVPPGDVLNEKNPRVLWTERHEETHTIVAMCTR